MTLLARQGVSYAEANWGRWVSRCATAYCRNAWYVGWGETWWRCDHCGGVNDVVWPPDPAAIEWVLGQRPDPVTRNWQPGETVEDLLVENAVHGLLPPGARSLPPVPEGHGLLVTHDDVVTGGLALEPVRARRELLAERHKARALEG